MLDPVRKIIFRYVDRSAYYRFAGKVYRSFTFTAKGSGFTCNCCGRSYKGTWFAEKLCPGCSSFPRFRLLRLYLEEKLDYFNQERTVFHVAPETVLRIPSENAPNLRYVSADLFAPEVDVRVDLSDMFFIRSETFDLFICYHVLEHVPDDRSAMRELFRILKPGGIGLLQVPMKRRPGTEEDPYINDPEEQERRFGQWNHVRWYGLDFRTRLEEAGFEVHEDKYASELPNEKVKKLALDPQEVIYRVRRPE